MLFWFSCFLGQHQICHLGNEVLSREVALATLHYKMLTGTFSGPDKFNLSSFKKINSSPSHIQSKTALGI